MKCNLILLSVALVTTTIAFISLTLWFDLFVFFKLTLITTVVMCIALAVAFGGLAIAGACIFSVVFNVRSKLMNY
ncbi:MAG: hypothetical protein QM528_07450 [Phycisphaerales bacterium]|nr:hypothetical protein [Phycisphaerales bacterium]MDI9358765.1 hypothetical protein [Phycisphaerales bacterium]